MITFATAGLSASFNDSKLKYPQDLPAYMRRFGLNGFEVQCGRGINVTEAAIGFFRHQSELNLSLHSPYYISISSVEVEKRAKSVGYILESANTADAIGADRVVVHAGSCAKLERGTALCYALETLKLARKTLDSQGLAHIAICPETMGKINQLGTLSEVLELCAFDERMIPCVDFGHLNSRTHGAGLDYSAILDEVEDKLGTSRLKNMHIHFSKQEFSKGGEKTHLTFAQGSERGFGPEFEPLMEQIAKRAMVPFIVCESDGTQAEDCSTMAKYYRGVL
jgi:deoxyribonuclease-4